MAEPDIGFEHAVRAALARAVEEQDHRQPAVRAARDIHLVGGGVTGDGDGAVEEAGVAGVNGGGDQEREERQ